MDEEIINQTAVDFTNDSHNQYGDFWSVYKKYIDNHLETIQGGKEKRNTDLRHTFVDPDMKSETLQHYHKKAWSSRLLPNGESMTLAEAKDDKENNVLLLWKENEKEIKFCFASDVMFTSFIGYDWIPKCINLFNDVLNNFKSKHNYRCYIEGYTGEFYRNIGSFIIFPKTNSINTARGINYQKICDRFDLTLYCIYKHYRNEKSPLSNVLSKNKDFFDLFVNFQRYVNFFCLDDLVDNGQVKDLMHNGCYINDKSFDDPFPKNPEEYFQWMENQLEFVQKRTKRINQIIREQHKNKMLNN